MKAKPLLKFRNFWPNFNQLDNFFIDSVSNEPIAIPTIIESVFESKFSSSMNKLRNKFPSLVKKFSNATKERRVWFTGENIRPPFGVEYDAYISFDQDDYGGKNFYFPLLYCELNFRSNDWTQRRGIDFTTQNLLLPRSNSEEKTKFACAFIGNPEPTRLRAIEALSKFGKVDIFGPHSGESVISKYEIAKNYRFMVCFENDVYPGYVTEKLLDAYLCGTVPLYRGEFGRESHVNRKSFINANDYGSLSEFAAAVAALDSESYNQIFTEPLLNSIPPIAPLISALTGKQSS
jgi:hypothetical protein